MRDSTRIDAALVAKLLADTGPGGLMTLMTDGVYFDEAKPGATKFVRVSVVETVDVGQFGATPLARRAYESILYRVEAVALGTTGANVNAAALRIDELLEGQPLTAGSPPDEVPGYRWMTTHRESRERSTEVDEIDPSIRWQSRGGLYRVEMSIDPEA